MVIGSREPGFSDRRSALMPDKKASRRSVSALNADFTGNGLCKLSHAILVCDIPLFTSTCYLSRLNDGLTLLYTLISEPYNFALTNFDHGTLVFLQQDAQDPKREGKVHCHNENVRACLMMIYLLLAPAHH